jgi:hypothetical protein
MKTIPLVEGDLRWVFPQLADPAEVLEVLLGADAQMRRLADHLAVRPGWTGSGLEFCRHEHVTDIAGFAESGDVSFVVELWFPRTELLKAPRSGPPWEVDAETSVHCDARRDCGMHTIEELPQTQYASPMDAAGGMLAAATWLLERALRSRSVGGVSVIGTVDTRDDEDVPSRP